MFIPQIINISLLIWGLYTYLEKSYLELGWSEGKRDTRENISLSFSSFNQNKLLPNYQSVLKQEYYIQIWAVFYYVQMLISLVPCIRIKLKEWNDR